VTDELVNVRYAVDDVEEAWISHGRGGFRTCDLSRVKRDGLVG
jgi:hypothetical protein